MEQHPKSKYPKRVASQRPIKRNIRQTIEDSNESEDSSDDETSRAPTRPNSVPPLLLQRTGKLWSLHRNVNEGVKMLTCEFCDYRTWKPSSMKAHKGSHVTSGSHPRRRSSPSGRDSSLDPRKTLPEAGKKSRNKRRAGGEDEGDKEVGPVSFQCAKCSYRGNSRDALTQHEKRVHGVKQFKCDDCGYATALKSLLMQHQRRKRSCKTKSAQDNEPKETAEETNPFQRRPLECDLCSFRCWQKSLMINHVRIHAVGEASKSDEIEDMSGGHKSAEEEETSFACKPARNLNTTKNTNTIGRRNSLPIKGEKMEHTFKIDAYIDLTESGDENMNQTVSLANSVDLGTVPEKSDCEPPRRVRARELFTPFRCEECGFQSRYRLGLRRHRLKMHTESDVIVIDDSDDGEESSSALEGHHRPTRDETDQVDTVVKCARMPVQEEVGDIMKPVEDYKKGTTEVVCRETDENCNVLSSSSSNSVNDLPTCPVCLKSVDEVYGFRCDDCYVFWKRLTRQGRGPPPCPGHATEGEEVDCRGCRWGRYMTASEARHNEITKS